MFKSSMKTDAAAIPHILIVDDDKQIRTMLAKFFRDYGFNASEAENGREMAAVLDKAAVNVVVLDIMMPGDDGLTLCRQLRQKSDIPIILLTAVSEDADRIVGLELGADDYVTKPFNPRELLARVRGLIRRSQASSESGRSILPTVYKFGEWVLDINRRSLTSSENGLVDLTSNEFDLLVVFTENRQRIMNRDQLLSQLHGRDAHKFDRSIDVQISRLRRKIERDPQNPELIKTVRNEGYFFTADISSDKDEGV